MKLSDISSDTWMSELNEDSDSSIASIAQWYRGNIGSLNNLISSNYYIDPNTFEIINSDSGTEIGVNEVAIFKKMFLIYYYSKTMKKFLGVLGIDTVKSINQDGIIVVLNDRNQISKIYLELKKNAQEELKQLLNNFKFNKTRGLQVEGDDKLPIRPPLLINPLNNASTY
jgi:hypothetical protein